MKRILDSLITPSGGTRFPALDGLRGLAVLLVILQHAPIIGQTAFGRHGAEAVTIFFALSAFLLFYPWAVGKKTNVKSYYWRRTLRIYPAYLVALAFGIFATWFVGKAITWPDILSHLTFTHAIYRNFTTTLIPAAWSLPAEIQFYLILPILAWAVASRPIEKLSVLFVALCIYQIHFAADSTPWRNLPVLLGPFVLGMLVAILVARLPKIKSEWLLLGLPVAIAIRMYYVHHQYLVISSSSWNMLLEPRGLICAIALSATLLGVATSESLGKTIFSWEPLRVIGICGYGIFIFHNTTFTLLGHFLPPLGVIFLGVPLAIIAGMLSYLYIELPFQNYSHSGSFRRVGRPATPQPLFLKPAPQSTEE